MQLQKFIRKDVDRIHRDGFNTIECYGNSYNATSCECIAELISRKASEKLWYADFSNMLVAES